MIEHNEILQNIIRKYNLNPYINYRYIGATIINKIDYPNHSVIQFCEDGFVDENGMPYIMQADILGGDNKSRIIVLYANDLDRVIIPVEGDNWTLIGNEIPENVKNIDCDKAKKIFHRKTLEIKKEPEKLEDSDIENLKNIYWPKYKKGRLTVAGLVMSIEWFIIIGLIVVFTIANNDDINGFMTLVVFFGGVMAWILVCILTVIFFRRIPLLFVGKFRYRSEFLVEGVYKKEKCISGLAYDEEACRRMVYGIAYYDAPLLDEMKHFSVVYRYSKKPYPGPNDYCMFINK